MATPKEDLKALLDAQPDELAIARHLELFDDYEVIDKLDLLQDLDVLVALDDEV